MSKLSFDQVFHIWLYAEVNQIEGRDLLPVAKSKGFSSISEWRLATALRLGMDSQTWSLENVDNPEHTLPDVLIGPYQGWSKLFTNNLTTTFKQALDISEFFEWCKTHDRIPPLAQHFPLPTTVILYRLPNGQCIHIEGGHRMCAVAFAQKTGQPIQFIGNPPVHAAIADVDRDEIPKLLTFLHLGTGRQ